MSLTRSAVVVGCAIAVIGLGIAVTLTKENHNFAKSLHVPLSQENLATSISEQLELLVSKEGFVDRVDVSIQKCNLVIETHYNRPCNSDWNGALLSRTEFIDMHELSGRPDDLKLFSHGDSVLALVWELLPENLENSMQGKTTRPGNSANLSHIVRSVCLGEDRILNVNANIYIGLQNEADSDLLSDMMSYKTNFCVKRWD